MKKIFSFMALILAGLSALTFTSCSDDDDITGTSVDREFMTMFITDYTRGKGDDYPYNCGLDAAYPHGNTIHLYWYGVKDCAGYQIQMALQPKVSGGADAWNAIQGTDDLLLNEIVGPDQLDMVIKDLQYSTDYRFAIRALSPLDDNVTDFSHASKWYGHGNGRQWQEWMGISTRDRYPTPFVVYANQAETTETTLTIYLNTNLKDVATGDAAVDAENEKSYRENFNIDEEGNFGYKILTVKPSPNNPNSQVNDKWRNYVITDADREKGYVVVDGLSPNSVYVIDVIDPTVPVEIDAKYNTCTARSDGKPGEPILLKHDEMISTYHTPDMMINPTSTYKRVDVYGEMAAKYDAAPISPVLDDFISNTNYAEGQTFLLEGGKTYYIDGNNITCKGFVLRTNPEDVAKGLRARVICGIGKSSQYYNNNPNGEQWQGSYSIFTFGRQPEAGEGGEIYMKTLAFYDIDFDNPLAYNYGDNVAGKGSACGNYFFNMYSNGMAVTLEDLIIENCTFKRLVRGFIREQGVNYKKWNHVLIKDNQFFDCGYYSNGAGGYCWIDGSGANNSSNLYKKMEVIGNTFYDSPFPAFFKEEKSNTWGADIVWNITFSNNTLVNFNTRGNGSIFKMRNLPNGSVFNVENNLFVLTKKPGDLRVLEFYGADIRETMPLADGTSGVVTLNFNNNWSTNDNLTNGQIFSGNPWTATSNNFGKLVKENKAVLNGTLEVNVAKISSTDLMNQPCPPHVAKTSSDPNMHRADALDGTATTEYGVNLFFKNKDNEIYKNNAGAPYWRQ